MFPGINWPMAPDIRPDYLLSVRIRDGLPGYRSHWRNVDCLRSHVDKRRNSEIIGLNEIGFGLMISLILFGVITLSYIIEGRIWGLSPFFRIPLFTVFIPFAIHLAIKSSDTPKFAYISSLLLVSIAISGILGIAFNSILFKVLEYFNINNTCKSRI